MGCVASRIDKEERVQICKERKRLMKQLVGFRGEFADAQLAYLRALKNTGVTLRQFTESESLDLDDTYPSPPLPLPPSPPPPPPFSPDLTKSIDNQKEVTQEEGVKIDEEDGSPPRAPIVSSSWNMWDPFELSLPQHQEKIEMVELVREEENWAETRTEFEEEDQEQEVVGNVLANSLTQKQLQQEPLELVEDDSSMMSWCTKDTADVAIVLGQNKTTLAGIIKELDDYFLKASASGDEIAILMDISKGDSCQPHSFEENKRKRTNSARVFSALSWSWSSKSLQLEKDEVEVCGPNERCKPGAHCLTLDKLSAAEKKLYKNMREEEMIKLEHEKKSMLLLKQEEENHDWTKTDKTRLAVEGLETDIRRLQHSISCTCSSILELGDMELYPQLVTLTSGLKNMWRTIYECHQRQKHISQQLNHLTDYQSTDFTTDYHRQATAELEHEVTCWYISFCKLIKSQQEYVRALCRWIQLTNCLVGDHQQSRCLSAVRGLCEQWQLVFDKLPDKIASEALKSFLSAIQSIMQQQAEAQHLHKRSDKLDKRLQKELFSLAEMEKKLDWNLAAGNEHSILSPKHPLSLKRTKIEALRKRLDTEKTKSLNSVQVTKAMTLNNLKTTLPNVFETLMGFSSTYALAFDAVLSHGKLEVDCDVSENSMN